MWVNVVLETHGLRYYHGPVPISENFITFQENVDDKTVCGALMKNTPANIFRSVRSGLGRRVGTTQGDRSG